MSQFFQGKYRPYHPEKYVNQAGLNNIWFRSSWEKSVMLFLDKNPHVVKWGSEEVVVKYINKLDGKVHRYFMDFYVEFDNGKKVLVEVKPYHQTQEPKKSPTKRPKTFLNEVNTYITNLSKWEQAANYAKSKGMEFQIWTEKDLEKLGININHSKKFRYINYGKRKRVSGIQNPNK